jgi:hypothetical protein
MGGFERDQARGRKLIYVLQTSPGLVLSGCGDSTFHICNLAMRGFPQDGKASNLL